MVEFEEVVEEILQLLKSMFMVDRLSIYILHPSYEYMTLFANTLYEEPANARNGNSPPPSKKPLKLALKGVAAYVASQNTVINVVDCYSVEFFDASMDMQTGYRSKQMLAMPIHSPLYSSTSNSAIGSVIGVIQCINPIRSTSTAKSSRDGSACVTFTKEDIFYLDTCCKILSPLLLTSKERLVSSSSVLSSASSLMSPVSSGGDGSNAGWAMSVLQFHLRSLGLFSHQLASHRHVKLTVSFHPGGPLGGPVHSRTTPLYPNAAPGNYVALDFVVQFEELRQGDISPSACLILEAHSRNNHPIAWACLSCFDDLNKTASLFDDESSSVDGGVAMNNGNRKKRKDRLLLIAGEKPQDWNSLLYQLSWATNASSPLLSEFNRMQDTASSSAKSYRGNNADEFTIVRGVVEEIVVGAVIVEWNLPPKGRSDAEASSRIGRPNLPFYRCPSSTISTSEGLAESFETMSKFDSNLTIALQNLWSSQKSSYSYASTQRLASLLTNTLLYLQPSPSSVTMSSATSYSSMSCAEICGRDAQDFLVSCGENTITTFPSSLSLYLHGIETNNRNIYQTTIETVSKWMISQAARNRSPSEYLLNLLPCLKDRMVCNYPDVGRWIAQGIGSLRPHQLLLLLSHVVYLTVCDNLRSNDDTSYMTAIFSQVFLSPNTVGRAVYWILVSWIFSNVVEHHRGVLILSEIHSFLRYLPVGTDSSDGNIKRSRSEKSTNNILLSSDNNQAPTTDLLAALCRGYDVLYSIHATHLRLTTTNSSPIRAESLCELWFSQLPHRPNPSLPVFTLPNLNEEEGKVRTFDHIHSVQTHPVLRGGFTVTFALSLDGKTSTLQSDSLDEQDVENEIGKDRVSLVYTPSFTPRWSLFTEMSKAINFVLEGYSPLLPKLFPSESSSSYSSFITKLGTFQLTEESTFLSNYSPNSVVLHSLILEALASSAALPSGYSANSGSNKKGLSSLFRSASSGQPDSGGGFVMKKIPDDLITRYLTKVEEEQKAKVKEKRRASLSRSRDNSSVDGIFTMERALEVFWYSLFNYLLLSQVFALGSITSQHLLLSPTGALTVYYPLEVLGVDDELLMSNGNDGQPMKLKKRAPVYLPPCFVEVLGGVASERFRGNFVVRLPLSAQRGTFSLLDSQQSFCTSSLTRDVLLLTLKESLMLDLAYPQDDASAKRSLQEVLSAGLRSDYRMRMWWMTRVDDEALMARFNL
eukprot:scaffold4347_cov269-Ochromonas_danica.AAC.8